MNYNGVKEKIERPFFILYQQHMSPANLNQNVNRMPCVY